MKTWHFGAALVLVACAFFFASSVAEAQVGSGAPLGQRLGAPAGQVSYQPQYGYGAPAIAQCVADSECGATGMCVGGVCQQFQTVTRPRLYLLIPGVVAFGAAYVVHAVFSLIAASFASSSSSPNSDEYLLGLIPLAGPWVHLGFAVDRASMFGTTIDDGSLAYYSIDGILQIAGLTTFILSLVFQASERVPLLADVRDNPEGGVQLGLAPGGFGLAF